MMIQKVWVWFLVIYCHVPINSAGLITIEAAAASAYRRFLVVQSQQQSLEYTGQEIRLGIYQHYKGDFYELLGVCKHTETEDVFAYYRGLHGNYQTWVRPLAMFLEIVEIKEIGKLPRFTYVASVEQIKELLEQRFEC